MLQQLAEGQEEAFTAIYRSFSKRAFALAMRYVDDDQDAAEIVQKVFIRLWERRTSLHTIHSIEDYLFVSTRNAVMDYLRQLSRQTALITKMRTAGSSGTSDNPISGGIDFKTLEHLWQGTINALPPQQRQVYELIERQGLSIDEVAGTLNISKGTVKKHLEVARRTVRKTMARELEQRDLPPGISGALIFLFIFS